jgi:muramoyltetrapeptide carboxypeptidase
MDIPTIRPRPLQPGDAIGIIAPAGPVENREVFDRSLATLGRMGFRVRFDDRIFQATRYLAGSDEARADELHRLFEDPEVRAIFSLRGGYGCSRLIPLLNEKLLRSHCKIFIGFSDLTTLHLFFRRRFGWVTLHGPMAASPALADITPTEEAHLLSLLTDPEYLPRLSFPQLETWAPGSAEGRLVGGCLSIIAASIGTQYEIKTEGKILFLEDYSEPPYRIDRMLTHLSLAGKLDSIAGVLLGTFHECQPERGDYTVEDVLRECFNKYGVPVLGNFPAGHGTPNWSLPLGVRVRLDADSRALEVLEPATQLGP